MTRAIRLLSSFVATGLLACGAPQAEPAAEAPLAPTTPEAAAAAPEAVVPAEEPPEAAAVGGVVRLGEKSLELVSAVAVWLPQEKAFEVSFYPFETTDEEIETTKNKASAFVVMRRPSPDGELWPSWCPHVMVKVELSAEPEGPLSLEHVKAVHVNVPGMEAQGETHFASTPREMLDEATTFGAAAEDGGTLELATSGTIGGDGGALTYELHAKTAVHVCGPPRCR